MITSGLQRAKPLIAAETQERRVIADSLVRFSVRQRPKPSANDAHAVDGFRAAKPAQARAPFLGHDSGWMIWKSR